MIVGLFSQMLTAGGIERVSRHVAVILAELANERGVPVRLLSLNDPVGEHPIRVGDLSAMMEGFGFSKGRYAAAAIAAARRATDAYFVHPRLAQLALLMRLARPSLRTFVHLHGVEAWSPLPSPARVALRRATTIISISDFTARRAREVQGIARDDIAIVPNALDPDIPRAESGASHGARGHSMLTVARLAASERYKGVDSVIRALPAIRRRVPDASYLVIGDGDDRPRLAALAQELQVDDGVRFVGFVPEAELIRAYAACDVFVMPSRGEGFGVAFLEAMTFAKPVVAGAHGGAPEVVMEGETGYLVDGGDVDAVGDRLTRLLTDDALRERMGRAGRRRVETHFTFAHFRRRLRAVLEAARGS